MRTIPTLILLCSLPFVALAQNYSNAPLLAVDHQATAPQPEAALKAIAPSSDEPPRPNEPKAPSLAPTPNVPVTPPSPPSPVNKLWPRDTAAIFVTSCSKLRSQSIEPCRCIINGLMSQMLHDEFLRLSEGDLIASDSRYLSLREQCIASAKLAK